MHARLSALFQLMATSLLLCLIGCDREPAKPPVPAAATQPAVVGTVRAAAAADLKFALDEVIVAFQSKYPAVKVTPTYGSSGNFYSQLSNKAPFDIYFSADIDYPRKLIEAGHASKDTQFDYAVGQIVVWVRKDSPVNVEKLGIEALADPSVKKIAIANPQHAPYGRAAEAAMKKLGIHDRVKDRLVLGENIAQTAMFVESGNADIGIIALSLALAPAMKDKGTYWLVPMDAYPTLKQGGVILNWAENRPAADAFKLFVTGSDGRAILKRYGFILPGE